MIRIIVLFSFCLAFVSPTLAQSKILINEFLIDPQPQSVEIFNSGSESADLSDWVIDDSGGTTFYTIPKNSIVFPNQCLVFSGDFNLNKASSDTIRFVNNSLQLIDSFSYRSSSGSGISYFRFPDNDDYWTTGSANLGLYNQTNVSCLITPSPSPTPTLTPTLIQPTPTDLTDLIKGSVTPDPYVFPTNYQLQPTTFSSYDNIYISEVMVNPPTGEKEWMEIYNDNDFSVSLNNWFIDDQESAGSSPKIFSLIIDAKSYGVADLTSSMFNNDGDSVRLLDFNKNPKDDFEYQETESGKTLGRNSLESDNFCLQEPSKNSANNPCINPMLTITPILSVITGRINPSPTKSGYISVLPAGRQVNQTPIKNPTLQYLSPFSYPPPPDVLGTSDELIINSTDNILLINLLCFLSFSYSLLTIISILFKMKLSYGKNKNFYSSFVRSS